MAMSCVKMYKVDLKLFLFNITNPIISLIQIHLHFAYFFYNIVYHFWIITWMKEANNFQTANIQLQVMLSFCLILAIFSLLLLIKVLLIKKRVEHVCCGVCILIKLIRSPIWISTNVKNVLLVNVVAGN